ncbi:pyocin knob domain-containing protein [Lachnospiraceae bacterium NSJ-143]|nr:pyocin knob domain-containing protein [Lachnospiraceae bacterium NSJ-143]
MSTNTKWYGLKKPEQEDFYDIDDFNENADIIDEQLKVISEAAGSALPASSYTAADVLAKIKTVDGSGSGLDADLFKGKSVIPVANGGTGAATAAAANLAIFGGHTTISGNGDLNNYVSPGLYCCNTDATAKTVKNTPFSIGKEHGFSLMVTRSGGGVMQILTTYTDNHGYFSEMYIRSQYPNNFIGNTWVKVIGNNNLSREVQSLLTNGSVSMVRQVLNGIATADRDTIRTSGTTVSISLANYKKAAITINGDGSVSGIGGSQPYVASLSNTSMTIKCNYSISGEFSYCIVEYY